MTPENKLRRIAIIGLPNTGKSQIFNNLTGEYTLVANFPLTTVESKKGRCKIGSETFEVIDTPGLHCLYIHSEEELAVRNMLLDDRPDIIIQCIDANRLKQSLTLTADLLEFGIPMVISLNAIDETTKKGMWIDSDTLSRTIGVPVIESVAVSNLGTRELKNAVLKARTGPLPANYGGIIEKGIETIEKILPDEAESKRKLAILLLLKDPFLTAYFNKKFGEAAVRLIIKEVRSARERFSGNVSWLVNNKRNKWITSVVEKSVRKQKLLIGGFSQTFAQLCRHPVFGIPIFLAVVVITYLLVVNVANGIAGWLEATLWFPVEAQIDRLLPAGVLKEFLIGQYGVLSLGLANAFLTVLPILSVFFLVFNTLEDVGYIPNLSVLTKRILDKLGLSGNSIMPLVLGFGCKTMATLTTKSLKSFKERYISIYLIAFAIPCAAQMGLNMSILGRMGFSAFLISFGTLALVELLAGIILNRMIKEEQKSAFIQELPKIRMPNIRAVMVKTYYRLVWFLKEAVPVFIMAAVSLFVIDKIGLLNIIKVLLSPLMINWLGLPIDMVDALIVCMARHEAAAGMIIQMIERGQLDFIQCIVAVTITTMFVPCFANIVAMIKELGAKTALLMALTINASAFFLAGVLHWVLVWTIR